MVLNRGDIWWASLAVPRGSEPGIRRSVVVVQSDAFNASRIPTVTVAVITSNTGLSEAPGNLALTPAQSGLPRESVINVSQLITLDKRDLSERVSTLPAEQLSEMNQGLRLVLSLV